MSGSVIVVGAINADLVLHTTQRPLGGETVMAEESQVLCGGKGANQAAAASRAGAKTAMVGAIGDDSQGLVQRAALEDAGVDVGPVITVPDVATGLAVIQVTPDGENSIVVVRGANGFLPRHHLEAHLSGLGVGDVLVLQTEVSPVVLDHAASIGAAVGCRVVINNGPWVPLSRTTLAHADPLIVNVHEARDAIGDSTAPVEQLASVVRRHTGARSVIVTQGERGVFATEGDAEWMVPAVRVSMVVDTTGAGDTFVGTVCAVLAAGGTLQEAARTGVIAAADCVTWVGARPARQGVSTEDAVSRA